MAAQCTPRPVSSPLTIVPCTTPRPLTAHMTPAPLRGHPTVRPCTVSTHSAPTTTTMSLIFPSMSTVVRSQTWLP
ncbi:hypothetical protein DPMN_099882 [Dreissena polymorpha]|uniref:Uncharacterized protein n=1 Tax=Dreissena polymorpha TaxID=45954 RepID=A0A9D4LI41_DREPO|nr:hypothetical protein DPMN_099882 [Dreissena polymorpha]